MKGLKLCLLIAGISLAASAAEAAKQNATGCPSGAWTEWAAGQTVSISWTLSGAGAASGVALAFQPTKIVFGGGIAPLTPVQAQAYLPTLDNLRAAATARRKVTIYWDDVTKVVSTFIVRWDQPC